MQAGEARSSITEPGDGLPPGPRRWAVLTIGLGVGMAVLDGAIANIALPTIAVDVHASAAASIWVVNAFQLAITISLLPLASLGDILGYRRIYLCGLALFTIASLGCALSDSLLTLTVARIIQGFGAAGIMSVNSALVRFIFPRAMLGRGIGINAMVVAVSSALGPTVASAILAVGNWPWLFAVNVPLGLAAVAIGWRALPRSGGSGYRFDIVSALLNAVTFGGFITSIDSFGHGGSALLAVGELAVSLLAGSLLVRRQLALPLPLLPIDLLRIPVFSLSVGTSVCSFVAQALAFVSLPFYFHDQLGRGQVMTGLLMTPWPVVVGLVAPVAGRLADRYPPGILGGIGMAIFAVGLTLLGVLPAAPGWPDIVWRMALCGLGFGLFQSPNNRAMLGAAPLRRSGGAAGMLSTARLLGQTSGAALVALIFGLAGLHGTTASLFLAACFAVAATVVSSLRQLEGVRPRIAVE